jgi:hypothetical protein
VGYDSDRFDARQIRRSEDPAARFRRNRDRADPGMRVGAADKGDFHSARQFDVGDELAAPVEMAVVLLAQ